jgi:diguanylate cyclase
MSMFYRDKHDAKKKASTEVPAESTQTAAREAISDQVLDTLAGMLRAYGSQGFDIETMEAVELERRCNVWARHILTGTPAPMDEEEPGDQEKAEPVSMDQRRWADLQRFFRYHRRDEQAAVNGSAEGMRGLISELASGLRSAIDDDSTKDRMVSRELTALSNAAQGNSLNEIRAQLARTVDMTSRVIQERQLRYEAQLQSMGKRVSNLRADLMAAHEKVDLDALTRLHNRGAFDEVLARQVEFSFLSGQPLALMMLDLDNFKLINDTYGHPAGDLVLQTVANAIVRVFPRRSDFIARYGGEEFVIMLLDVNRDELIALGQRMLEAVRNLHVDYKDNSIRLTCSVGIAANTQQDTAETLLGRADKSLYMAKRDGRDKAVLAME